MSKYSLMIFAAGYGKRMKKLTKNKPKSLLTVGGKPLINHALDIGLDFSPKNIVVNAHFHHEMLIQHLKKTPIKMSLEYPTILETGGGLRKALSILDSNPVMTLNSDTVWFGPNALSLLAKNWQPKKMDGLLLCTLPNATTGYTCKGDFATSKDGKLRRNGDLIYTGAQIIKTDLLYDIKKTKFSVNLLWDKIINQKRLYGIIYPGKWFEVGTPERLSIANNFLNQQDNLKIINGF